MDGVKDVENRNWPTDFRGPILVHAPKTVDWPAVERLRESLELGATGDYRPTTGAIVGVAEIVDCVSSHPSRFFVGPYGFVLRGAARLPEPLPARGRLGIFAVPATWLDAYPNVLARFGRRGPGAPDRRGT